MKDVLHFILFYKNRVLLLCNKFPVINKYINCKLCLKKYIYISMPRYIIHYNGKIFSRFYYIKK